VELEHMEIKNLKTCGQNFNKTSFWVQAEILIERTPKLRAKKIEKFLQICQHLIKFNNFSGVMQIVGALTSLPISRLHQTWSKISDKMNTLWESQNMKFFTETFYDGSNINSNLIKKYYNSPNPSIPYIGSILSEIIKISEMPRDSKVLSIKQLKYFSKSLTRINESFQNPYDFKPILEYQYFFHHLPELSENELDTLSYYHEPKIGLQEKVELSIKLSSFITNSKTKPDVLNSIYQIQLQTESSIWNRGFIEIFNNCLKENSNNQDVVNVLHLLQNNLDDYLQNQSKSFEENWGQVISELLQYKILYLEEKGKSPR